MVQTAAYDAPSTSHSASPPKRDGEAVGEQEERNVARNDDYRNTQLVEKSLSSSGSSNASENNASSSNFFSEKSHTPPPSLYLTHSGTIVITLIMFFN